MQRMLARQHLLQTQPWMVTQLLWGTAVMELSK
jgi:hypothetical protein